MAQQVQTLAERKAKLFLNNRSQAVRLPKEFRFEGAEVFIRREGDDVVLSSRPKTWSDFLRNGPIASPDFMDGVDDPPPEDIEF